MPLAEEVLICFPTFPVHICDTVLHLLQPFNPSAWSVELGLADWKS